jgi:cellulose synthase (UDP-forming)
MTLSPHLRSIGWVVVVTAASLVFGALVVLPMDLASQAVFGACLIAAGLLTARLQSRFGTLLICGLTLFASTRYLVWRFGHSLGFHSPIEWLFGGGLFLAEVYTWVVLVLSFLQQARPLHRPVAPLGLRAALSPTVDVYVPTYNEPLSVIETTIIAALAMDYPQDRFKVWLLDDGDRPEFAAFAERVGCEYLARTDNHHAKAGNLNEAMKVTDGELICILDCDHVPTRAFLQLTVGWFEVDPMLALVQTPHFFYSPDPVQRNIKAAEQLPGEGDLFYDTIQSGNDLWNAAFFCGSCAVIRRQALDEVGGFAFETVTEDAHTALRIQRRGWNTSFLNIRLSAGLATESLAQHISQRARWCRGMTQILRIDNPLAGPGLTLPQRLCYLNALLYYQFPLVRVAFLTSPLIYLFFGLNPINAPAGLVLAYAAPHLVQSMLANQRLQGRQRRLLWGEIYETILAFHLIKPALFTLFSPKAGKFNVTDKGLKLEEGYFAKDLVRPHLITAGLLVLGLVFGCLRLLWPEVFHESVSSLALTSAWTIFNLLILLSAVAVAREQRQVRTHVRRTLRLPVTVYFADGRVIDAQTENVSAGGLAIKLPQGYAHAGREVTHVDLAAGGGRTAFPVDGIAVVGGELRVRFQALDRGRERRLVQALMARADAWQPARGDQLRPELTRNFATLLEISGSTCRFIGASVWRQARRRLRPAAAAAAALMFVLGSPHPARAAAVERVIPLEACQPAAARVSLPGDEVVLAARLEGAAAVLVINGQRVAVTGSAPLDPAVFLPGANEIRIVSANGRCPATPLRIVLSAGPLTPTPVAAPPLAAASAPAVSAPVVLKDVPAAAPAAVRSATVKPSFTALAWETLRQPLLLTLLALGSVATIAFPLSQALERQVQSRLMGLPEGSV